MAEMSKGADQVHGGGDFGGAGGRMDCRAEPAAEPAGASRRGGRTGGGAGGRGRRRAPGNDHRPADAEAVGGGFVEVVRAGEELLQRGQEPPRLGALDHAVVVRAADRHDRAPGQAADRARGHDRALARHQPRHRGGRAHRARVGQGEAGTGQIVGCEAVASGPADQVVIASHECGEVQFVGRPDDRHDQERTAVSTLRVHGKTEVDGGRIDAMGPAFDLDEVAGQARVDGRRLGHCVCDQVGEREPGRGDGSVELRAPRNQDVGRYVAERRRRRDAETRGHVGYEAGADAVYRNGPGLGPRSGPSRSVAVLGDGGGVGRRVVPTGRIGFRGAHCATVAPMAQTHRAADRVPHPKGRRRARWLEGRRRSRFGRPRRRVIAPTRRSRPRAAASGPRQRVSGRCRGLPGLAPGTN